MARAKRYSLSGYEILAEGRTLIPMLSAKTKKWALAGAGAIPVVLLLLVWRAASRRPRLFPGIGAPATAIALSRDGSQIVCTSENGTIQKWMPDEGRFNSFYVDPVQANGGFSTDAAPPIELRLSPDGSSLVAANLPFSGQAPAFSWTMNDRKTKWVLMQESGVKEVYLCAISSDARLLSCVDFQSITILDLTRSIPLPPAPSRPANLIPRPLFASNFSKIATLKATASALAFSPDAKSLVFATSKSGLQKWDFLAKKILPLPAAPFAAIGALAFSPDGRFLAATSADSLRLANFDWNTQTWTLSAIAGATSSAGLTMGNLGGFSSPVTPFVWMPDSHSLWTGGDKAQQWSAPDLKLLRELPVSGPVAVSGDGSVVATRSVPKIGQPNGIWLWPLG